MKRLLQINPVLRNSTSTGRIAREIGQRAMSSGWESYIAYSAGRDGIVDCDSQTIPVGSRMSVACHGLATRLFDRHGLASGKATLDFIRKIDALQPDIVQIHNIHGYFLNYQILFDYLSKSGIPVVWTAHDCWLYTGHCYYYSAIGCEKWERGCGHCPQRGQFPRSWVVDRSKRNFEDKRRAFCSMPKTKLTIVAPSQWIKGELSRSFLKDYDIKVIHNGIDTEVFNPRDETIVREKYALGDAHILLGVASIWSKEKGFEDFIKLSERLSADERLVIVGVSEKQREQLPESVLGIGRTANVGELAQLYSSASAFVNLTYQDNFPTVNLEAISCGTPVVTYKTGGSIEAVTTETGATVVQGDIDGVLDSVRTIEANGKEHYRNVCRKEALSQFRKEDRYADYLRLYEELTR